MQEMDRHSLTFMPTDQSLMSWPCILHPKCTFVVGTLSRKRMRRLIFVHSSFPAAFFHPFQLPPELPSVAEYWYTCAPDGDSSPATIAMERCFDTGAAAYAMLNWPRTK